MSTTTHGRFRAGLILAIVTGFVVFCVVTLMAIHVARDLRLLETASSDNMQWTITQAEVEYLGMLAEVEAVHLEHKSDLSDVRRRFDIFYSLTCPPSVPRS
ncbi:hypothetical protein AB9K34_00265 [Sedimentitalea sp. XS_ASV28]|uniref:hypothetical protein n=1 Tax=Sedimentitalea sp. XS_ASV28 TaxID=3241296 RepID=UPI0035191E9C